MQHKHAFTATLCAAILSVSGLAGRAQTTATWTGPSSGGEWNTAADWDAGAPPLDSTTNAFIGAGTNVSYNLPMAAAGFGNLTNNGTLNLNTNGFNCSAIFDIVIGGGEKLFINPGGIVTVGSLTLGTNTAASLAAGASLTVNGALTLAANESSHASGSSILTNNGGYLSAQSTTINNNTGTGTGLLLINGGTNNLGNTAVGRNNSGAGGAALGTEGLVIRNGVVTMTNLNLGNAGNGASSLSGYITGGIVTNFGSVFINQGTSGRFSRLVQTGGWLVVPDPGVVNPNPTVSGSLNNYAINGGTNLVGGFYFGNTNGSAGTVNFTNAASIYVGSQGINWNGAVTLNASLNNGGLFGATAPWTSLVALKLTGGTFTFQTADLNNNPNNITLTGVLSGSGGLNLTGAGTLTLSAANTYSGNTLVLGGTLALGAGGSLASPKISLANGTSFDVTGTGGFTLNTSQTLAGYGTVKGPVTAAPSSTIYPGSNTVTGTLTFQGGLTENGGANNEFNLSSDPAGSNNDFINASGGLSLTGTNTITIIGSLAGGGVYHLINYGGNLTGDVTNFAVVGATGVLSNSPAAQMIYFVALTSVRGATNMTWIGNTSANNWDTELTTNWLNGGTGSLDFFVPNDNALFSDLGASNSTVNLPGTVTPGSITINTSSNYTFTGNGAIGGVGSLTVSNGTLTMLTTNTYTGQTVLDGGVLATPNIADSGNPSGIGQATTDPGNILFNGGILSYYGASTGTDHGMTFTNLGGTFDVTNGTTLTINGSLIGNGGLTLIDSGTLTLTAGNSYSGGTTISNGTLNLNNTTGAGTGPIIFDGGTLGLTVSGQPTYANDLTVVSDSTLNSAGGNNNIVSGSWTGNSSVTLNVLISGTGTFSVNGGMTNYYGTVELGNDAGFFRFNAGGGNTQFGGTNATFDLGTNTVTLEARNPGTMALGALEGGPSTMVTGPSSTAGTLIWAIGSNPNNPSTTYYGTLAKTANANEISGLTKIGTGTFTLAGQNTYTSTTTISSGTLALTNNPFSSADGSIDNSATINLVSGAVLDVSGRSDATFQLGASAVQKLEGRGTIRGSLNAGSSGMVAPGGGPGGNTGILTVTNAITLGGTAWMKLNRANTPSSDQLVSSLSTVTYGGTLVVTNIGAKLQAGDSFTLFSGGGLSAASFGTVILPNYYTWNTSNLGVNGSITVTALLPPPAITSVDFSSLASGTITLNAANGAVNGPVTVLTSTNVALPIASWTSVATNTFDASGNLSLPVTVDPILPQSFFLLQAY